MTVSDLKLSIAEKLKEYYPDYDVYTESLRQGSKDRCFFIDRITAVKKTEIRSEKTERYSYLNSFSITVFSEDKKESLDEIADCLYHALTYIIFDGRRLKGINMAHTLSDNALIFMVDYTTEVNIIEDEIPKMEVLSVNGKTE